MEYKTSSPVFHGFKRSQKFRFHWQRKFARPRVTALHFCSPPTLLPVGTALTETFSSLLSFCTRTNCMWLEGAKASEHASLYVELMVLFPWQDFRVLGNQSSHSL